MSRFDQKAQDWDTPERQEHARAIAESIRAHVPLSRRMRAIDIGAGTGLLGLALAADVGSMVLAEPSAGMLTVAREKLAAGGPANVTAVPFDLPAEPPDGAPFDLAVSLLVLHHIEDTPAALRSIHDLLSSGGHLALVDLEAEDGSFHDDPEGIHHHGFDRAALCRAATTAGFHGAETRIVSEIERDGRPYPLVLLTAQRD